MKQIRAPPGPELLHGVHQFKLQTLGALSCVLEAAQPLGEQRTAAASLQEKENFSAIANPARTSG